MKIGKASLIALGLSLAICPPNVQSFQVQKPPSSSVRLFGEVESSSSATPCEVPEGVNMDEVASMVGKRGAGGILRSQIVTNSEGDFIPLASAMGEGTSIVIFLRHMG